MSNNIDKIVKIDHPKLKPYVKGLWLSELRSKKYQQGTEWLKTVQFGKESKYCCLGILTEIYLKEHKEEWITPSIDEDSHVQLCSITDDIERRKALPPKRVNEWALDDTSKGIKDHPWVYEKHISEKGLEFEWSLWKDNDCKKLTFLQIADIIEEEY